MEAKIKKKGSLDIDSCNIDQRVDRIFDLERQSVESTEIFKKYGHEQLIHILRQWIDYLKITFGYYSTTKITQGMRDQGVDLLLEFPSIGLKYGFQVNSHGDIAKKDFSKKVLSQITSSGIHKLTRYYILFAGDMTDLKSQGEKVRGKISEISQIGNHRIVAIEPEIFVILVDSYNQEIHPIKLLNHSKHYLYATQLVSDIFDVIRDDFNISLKLNLQPRHKVTDEDGSFSKIEMQLSDISEFNLMDVVKEVNITGESYEIPKGILSQYKIDGIDILNSKLLNPKGDLKVKIGPRKLLRKLKFELFHKDESEPFDVIEDIYQLNHMQDKIVYRSHDKNKRFRLELAIEKTLGSPIELYHEKKLM